MKPSRRRRVLCRRLPAALTLTELSVVIAIMAILAATLVPVSDNVKRKAQQGHYNGRAGSGEDERGLNAKIPSVFEL